MDTHVLKLSGKAESPTPLKIGFNIHCSLEGAITQALKSSNEDGTFTYLYTFKPVKVDLLTETGETLKLKDTRTRSQLLRAAFFRVWKENNYPGSFDTFYDDIMSEMIKTSGELVGMYHKV